MIRDTVVMAWLPRVLLALGLIAIAGAAAATVSSARSIAGADRASGVVTEMVRGAEPYGDPFAPLVSFATADGEGVEFLAGEFTSPPSYAPGDHVEVLYDPDTPPDARLTGFFDLWGDSTVVGLFGVVVVGMSWFARLLSASAE